MKLVILPMLFFSLAACAQQSGSSFSFSASFTGNGGKDIDSWFSKVSNIQLVSINPENEQELKSLWKDGYEEWFSVRHGKERLQLLSREGKGDVEEVVAVITGKEGKGLFFHLRGHFTADDKSRIKAAFDHTKDE